eukprot:1143451-Alexandrium_andersonii.AAC.1
MKKRPEVRELVCDILGKYRSEAQPRVCGPVGLLCDSLGGLGFEVGEGLVVTDRTATCFSLIDAPTQ